LPLYRINQICNKHSKITKVTNYAMLPKYTIVMMCVTNKVVHVYGKPDISIVRWPKT